MGGSAGEASGWLGFRYAREWGDMGVGVRGGPVAVGWTEGEWGFKGVGCGVGRPGPGGGPVGPVVSWAEARGGFSSIFFLSFVFLFYLFSFIYFLFCFKSF